MKFGKRLLKQMNQYWKEYYINYNFLKKELKKIKLNIEENGKK